RLTKPCLIVAPTSLMGNWRREAQKFAPRLKVLVLQGPNRQSLFGQMLDHDLILSTYPLLVRDEAVLGAQQYHSLILDEAQMVKNPNSKAAKIIRRIRCKHRLCLTGTPMENHLGELWTQFDFLMPGFLGSQHSFKKLFRNPIENHGNKDQRDILVRRITPFLLRRTKNEVIKELPEKTEIIRSVSLDSKQATLYESIRLSMQKRVRDAIAKKGLARSHITVLDALLKLRQICCDPQLLPLEQAKKVKQSAKLDMLMQMLPELLEEGRRILLFSQFTKMLAIIEQQLDHLDIAYVKLTGQTRDRDGVIDAFRAGAADVFLISLKAGGVGLNLTEADTVIHYDPWWNPAAEHQATGRAHRIGQKKPVFVYKLITENTVEEKIIAMQEQKQALADGIYDADGDGANFNFNAENLQELFAPLG
ncbi:MAG: DEAD/DEAH box helicase, partial [Thiohalomonadales bacterium]